MLSPPPLLQLALRHHNAGRLTEAEQVYRMLLATEPQNPDALHYLGVIAQSTGKFDEAVALIRQAVEHRPTDSIAWGNLGNALRSTGQNDAAVDAYRRAIEIDPSHADAHYNLAVLFRDTGRFDEAVAQFRAAIAVRPTFGNAVWTLGRLLLDHENPVEAVEVSRAFLKLDSRDLAIQTQFALSLHLAGQLEEAAGAWAQAVALDPADERAALGHGATLVALKRFDEAAEAYRRSLRINPNRADVLTAFGNLMLRVGSVDLAVATLRMSVGLKPDDAMNRSTLLFAMLGQPSAGPAELAAEHRRWNDAHAARFKSAIAPHTNDPDPDRRLRVGYVSSDFSGHVVGHQFLPIMEHRDRTHFEVTCYSNVEKSDDTTLKLTALADRWQDISKLDDDQAARMIRDDRIDILVDLNVHTGGHRLTVFARKPAPVQLTYLGYCGTTGLEAMDYRISDPFMDPPGTDLSNYSEKTAYLDHSYWCYPEPEYAPPVAEPAFIHKGFVTFGSMNAFRKVTPQVLKLWIRILLAVPDSMIMIHTPAGEIRDRTARTLAAAGISPKRICYVDLQARHHYLGTYGHIDISLDPFPYAGGITSCDGLWMGVPVVTLNGKQSPVSRGGVSILQNIGLPELIAQDEEEYFNIAVGLANDPDRLAGYRRGMRERMRRSPLMDIAGLAGNLESIYRRVWRDWCSRQTAGRG